MKAIESSRGSSAHFAEMDGGGLAVRPYAIAALEREFEGDERTIRYAFTAAPGIVNQWVLPERSDDVHGRITAGANFELGENVALQLNGTASVEREGGNDVAGFLALKLTL